MRAILFAAASAAAVGLSACAPVVSYQGVEVSSAGRAPLKTLAALDCPDREGALTRTARAPDGRRCDYAGPAGETVSLRLVALDGRTPGEALAPTKAALAELVPLATRPIAPIDPADTTERTDVDLPFIHVHSRGPRSEVKVFGVKVSSEGDYSEVRTNLGLKHTVVHAGPKGAEVVAEDIGRTNVDMVYVLAADAKTPSPYTAVGYVARGPVGGPLVVGEFRATDKQQAWSAGRHYHNRGGDALGRLIDHNLRG